jgi:hypothetical protein
MHIAGAEAEIVVVDQLGSRFECEFQLYPHNGGFRAVLCYNRARLDDDVAARLVRDYVATAGAVAASGPLGVQVTHAGESEEDRLQ